MAYIAVNRDKLTETAKAVENYSVTLKRKMQEAGNDVKALSASWEGKDFRQFTQQWEKATGGDSVYTKMVKALDSYAKYLRYAEAQYKDAQIKAINRANGLPR